MSSARPFLPRALLGSLLAVTALGATGSCGFPDHQFVSDSEFYASGGHASGGGGETGADARVGGSGGTGTSGTGGAPSTGGAGGIGTGGGTGGTAGTGGGGGTVGTGGTGVVGKGDAGPLPDASAGGTAGSGGAGGTPATDAGPDAADAGPQCGAGLTACPPAACVDLLSNDSHCGDCTTACTGGYVCTSGQCAPPCSSGLTLCTPVGSSSGICVDTTLDENDCGGCNKACPGGFVCESSKCVVDCGTLTRCGTQCYDLTTDDTHCGDCATSCKAIGQVCSGSKCQASCTFPYVACGATCVDPRTDDQNCNGCGNACAVGYDCKSSVCTKLVESCQNGTDDDEDGLVDCLDPDCTAGYTCATTPAGWTGPVAVWSGTAGTAPSCTTSGGYATTALTASDGLVVPSYDCPACTCTPSAGMYCDDLTFDVYNGSTPCSGVPWPNVKAPASGACQAWSLLGAQSVSANSAHLQNAPGSYVHGTCAASQPTPIFPAATWTTEVRGCSAPPSSGGGCGAGQCMPRPTAPYGAQLCVFKTGIATCPPDYPTQQPGQNEQYYQSITEGRSCSACGCNPACGGTVSVYAGSSCSGASSTLSIADSTTCSPVVADPNVGGSDHHAFQWNNPGAVCGTVPSTLSGAPTAESPITVCCQAP